MNVELRDDLKTFKHNSVYALLGTHLIVALVIIGELQSYISGRMSIGIIAICYMILTSYYYFKILYIANKHLDDK